MRIYHDQSNEEPGYHFRFEDATRQDWRDFKTKYPDVPVEKEELSRAPNGYDVTYSWKVIITDPTVATYLKLRSEEEPEGGYDVPPEIMRKLRRMFANGPSVMTGRGCEVIDIWKKIAKA